MSETWSDWHIGRDARTGGAFFRRNKLDLTAQETMSLVDMLRWLNADHEARRQLDDAVKALREIGSWGDCQTASCTTDDPKCEPMRARAFFACYPDLQPVEHDEEPPSP